MKISEATEILELLEKQAFQIIEIMTEVSKGKEGTVLDNFLNLMAVILTILRVVGQNL